MSTTTALAQTERELGAHEHGTARLNLVIEGSTLGILFETPSINMVGFEHAPRNAAQETAIEMAKSDLLDPATYFGSSFDLSCTVSDATSEWHGEDGEHDHGDDHGDHKDEHDHGDDHDDHKDEHDHGDDHGDHKDEHDNGDDHGDHKDEHDHGDDHDDHKDEHDHGDDHDDHKDEHDHGDDHDDHKDEHDHGDDHDDHSSESDDDAHSEFSAELTLSCANLDDLSVIEIALFEKFAGLEKIQFQAALPSGQTGGELTAENNRIELK
ncbi:MAG: DUF2796 domain-containing protein [Pseudomonadota bacterium]